MGDINNPKEIDNKNELIAFIVSKTLIFLKTHWWKLVLIILSIGIIFIPFIWIDGGLVGLFK